MNDRVHDNDRRRSIPVATFEPGASAELGETEPDDSAVLDHPTEVVAGTVARRPERTKVTVVVDVPLAPCRTTVFDVRGPAVRLENLGRMVGEHKLSRRQGPWDECRRDHVAVGYLDVIQPLHNPIVAMLGSRCKRSCRRPPGGNLSAVNDYPKQFEDSSCHLVRTGQNEFFERSIGMACTPFETTRDKLFSHKAPP